MIDADAAQIKNIPEELGQGLQQHQRNADNADQLDRPHIGPPHRMRPLAIFDGVGRARDAAVEQDTKIEQQEQNGDRVDRRLAPGRPHRIDQVHAHMIAHLHRIGAAEQIVTDHDELCEFKRPQRRRSRDTS
jgi:hypothetical protein